MTDKQFYIATAVILVGGYFLGKKAARAAVSAGDAIGEAVNPTSENNLIYKGLNAVGDTLDDASDNDSFSLGGWIYDIAYPGEGAVR